MIDLDLDQSITKSAKYCKYQKSTLYMKRVLYVSRKICLLIEAITNITDKKKYWRKYYKYCRKCYKYNGKYYKNIQSFMNMRKSIVKVFKVSEYGRKSVLARDNCVAITPFNKLRKHVLSRNDLKPFEITQNQME